MHNVLRILFILVVLLYSINECKADVRAEWRSDLVFDQVMVTNHEQSATVTVNASNGSYTKVNITSLTLTNGTFRVYNETSSKIYVNRDFSSINVSLVCSAPNCTTSAQSCNVTYKGTKSNNIDVASNSSWGIRLGGILSIPQNCGSGTFTGIATVNLKYGASSSSANTSFGTMNINITAHVNSSGESHSATVSNEQDLDFGTMISNASSSHQVTVSTAGVRTPTNYTIGNDGNNGIINITNQGAAAFSANVSVPASVTMYKGGTSNPMTATLTPSSSGSITLNPGSNYINIGGTLTVPSGQPSGDYSGNYTVTVSYD